MRGMKFTEYNIEHGQVPRFQAGEIINLSAPTSTSTEISEAARFAGRGQFSESAMMEIHLGKGVRGIATNAGENENNPHARPANPHSGSET